jgi:hypothetical protein
MGIMTGSGEPWEGRRNGQVIEELEREVASLKDQLARAIAQNYCTFCGVTLENQK